MNIQELHNRLIKKANMKKVAGPVANEFRKILNDFKAKRLNPQQRANLVNTRNNLEKAPLDYLRRDPLTKAGEQLERDILSRNINLLLKPSSEFKLGDTYGILNMAVSKANKPAEMREFINRIEKRLVHNRDERLLNDPILPYNDIVGYRSSPKMRQMQQDAWHRVHTPNRILAKKYLGDI